MNWFNKLFARREAPATVTPKAPPRVRPEAERISTETVSAHCDRLEALADRTGNAHLRKQAQRIRARLT